MFPRVLARRPILVESRDNDRFRGGCDGEGEGIRCLPLCVFCRTGAMVRCTRWTPARRSCYLTGFRASASA